MDKTRAKELFDVQITKAGKANKGQPYLYFFVKDEEKKVRLVCMREESYDNMFGLVADQYTEDGDCYLGLIKEYNDNIGVSAPTFPIFVEKT